MHWNSFAWKELLDFQPSGYKISGLTAGGVSFRRRNFDCSPEFNPLTMKRDDDQELWDLLGQAAEPKISPYFARNVLREVRKASDWTTFRGWLNPRRLIPVAGMVGVMIAVFLVRLHTSVAPLADSSSDMLASVDPMEYEVIADLDDLLASDDSNSLDEGVLL